MANQEHLKYFMRGMAAWNKWRNAHPDVKPDLRDIILSEKELREKFRGGICDLSETDLSGADLSGVNLKGARLVGANLSNANLSGADLSDFGSINLQRSNLSSINLSGSNLSHANLSNQNLSGSNLSSLDLSGANLSNTDLERANLNGANLSGANLYRSDLSGASLIEANLFNADLSYANLFGANLTKSNLRTATLKSAILPRAIFKGADLSEAILSFVDLFEADLSEAILSGAKLDSADFVGTNLKNTVLTGCYIYGISIWNVNLEGAIQSNLIITPPDEPTITVDNLEIAQFIYLLLNNQKIRDVIDTITSKVVLILGRFTPERKAILDSLRDKLREHNYTPVLFDFDRPVNRDFTETARTLAHLSRFILADITEPSSIPQELQAIVPELEVPVQPLLEEGSREYSMFPDFGKYPWVAPVYFYKDQTSLISSLYDEIIAPTDKMARELAVEKAKRLERL
jgi:uncharacterized protein YjbI with pentapeptide repeats